MNAFALVVAVLTSSFHQAVPVTVDLQPAEVISGTRNIRVSVGEVKGLVQQVEFYVNGDLRETVSGYPYNFKLDSLDLDDGDVKLDFEVQTTQGEKGKASVTVHIDNGVAKGVAFHVKQALELLSDSKFGQAEISGRIAMKAARKLQDSGTGFDEKRDMNSARVVLARAYLGLGRYDRAQKFAEDALAADPNNISLINLVSGVNLKRALRMVDREGNPDQARERVKTALISAIERQKEILRGRLEAMGAPTLENAIAYADLAFKAGRYSQAVQALMPAVHKNPDRADLANRLAYAQMKAERFPDARTTLRGLQRQGHPNAYSYALEAILDNMAGQTEATDEDMKEAILSGGDDLGVQLAQAHLALQANTLSVLGQILQKVRRDYPDCPEISAYMSDYTTRTGQPNLARSYFEDAVLQNPLLTEAFLREGRSALILSINPRTPKTERDFQLKTARMNFEVALATRNESAEALVGLAFCQMYSGNSTEAISLAKGATAASPGYAAGPYAVSAFYRTNRQIEESEKAFAVAIKIDKANLEGKDIPKTMDALRYFVRFGTGPIMTPP